MQASTRLRSVSSFSAAANDSGETDGASRGVIRFHSLLAGPSSSRILAAAFVPVALAPSPVPQDIATLAAEFSTTLDRLDSTNEAGGGDEEEEALPPTLRESGIFAKG